MPRNINEYKLNEQKSQLPRILFVSTPLNNIDISYSLIITCKQNNVTEGCVMLNNIMSL